MDRLQLVGIALMRAALGVVFLVHSAYLKVCVFTVDGTVGFFESLGLPGLTAYLVLMAEIVGGVMLIFGVYVREAAAVIALIGAGATWAHSGYGWLFTNEGGGWEYPLFLTVASVAQVFLGAGAFRLRLGMSESLLNWAKIVGYRM